MITYRLSGTQSVLRNLRSLTSTVQKKLNLHAVRAAGAPVVLGAIYRCPVGGADDPTAGLLKSSIDMKATTRGATAKCIIGPMRRVSASRGISTHRGRWFGRAIIATATRYASYVEFGTRKTPARPFMRPAWDDEGGDALERYLIDLKDGIAIEVSKLPNNPFGSP